MATSLNSLLKQNSQQKINIYNTKLNRNISKSFNKYCKIQEKKNDKYNQPNSCQSRLANMSINQKKVNKNQQLLQVPQQQYNLSLTEINGSFDSQYTKLFYPNTLYSSLGGKQNLMKIFSNFTHKIVLDPEINHYYLNTDMHKQEERQIQFWTVLFDGPDNYQGQSMKQVHKGMNISEKSYDLVLKYLCKSFQKYGATHEEIQKILEIAAVLKQDIVNQ
ncbi:Globin-like protein [Pseudocohnilembus persalinus]|uniref:Globin-like protein n=1 Tax=Pseudocohnilembus persalinus TaxID=266149 RepID=A0A0V0QXT6_PSEPJ|nr:Globin-like protein [Pseudocohnilembus persalinus]|eukprot:KRX06874.1 Globin-like protein [Pseudocohnilembus persalinus]